jgi:hypothetical protein
MKKKTKAAQPSAVANPEAKPAGATTDPRIRVVVLPLSALKLDPTIQCRANGVNQGTVKRYAERMKAGDKFPPLEAVQDGNVMLLADGWHRYEAALLAGFKSFEVRIRPGTRGDAVELAIRLNLPHGRPLAGQDTRRRVELALHELRDRSDGYIADLCKVTQSYVSRIHRRLRPVLSCSEKRRGLDGKVRKLPQKTAGSPSTPPAMADGASSSSIASTGATVLEDDQSLISFVEQARNTNPGLAQLLLDLSAASSMIGNRPALPGELAGLLRRIASDRTPPQHG